MNSYKIIHDNCFDWLKDQKHNSIMGVCTDPPYGVIEFSPSELEKMRNGNGGIWRIPPKIGGSQRSPLPRFTVLSNEDKEHVKNYFYEFGKSLLPCLCPGAHVFLAGTPFLQYLVQESMARAGFEIRGAIMRIYRSFRGGDRPKLAENEFKDICVTPRGSYEPWMLFRKPIQQKTVAANLRKWGTGALRRLSTEQPLPDIILSSRTPKCESDINNHPTLKPQHFLRIIVRSCLPLGEGTILDPFAGSGSTCAAAQAVGYDSIGVEIDDIYYSTIEFSISRLSTLYKNFQGDSLDCCKENGTKYQNKSQAGLFEQR